MRLDELLEEFERDEAAERRQLAKERSYEITEYLEDVEQRFESVTSGDSLFGSTAPSVFVGHHSYPEVPAGVLSPVGNEDQAEAFVTDSSWYEQDLGISDVFRRRTALLNANRRMDVRSVARKPDRLPNVHDEWDGFVGTQREVAIAERPVDVEIGLAETPAFDVTVDEVADPTGPWARAESAGLAENPKVPRAVEKTLSDDDWRAQGAMTYLYERGFDVYDIHRILSAGALGQARERRLVPTRWSITAVDDTVSKYLRGQLRNAASLDQVEVYSNTFMGNAYWVIFAPGQWEFELVEFKGAGSIWNPDPEGSLWIGADYEGFEGRTGYVGATAGAYYATRLAALEHLRERDRQAKVLVLRHVSDDYWGPVGVWQVRESVRNAFADEPGIAETFPKAVAKVVEQLPVSMHTLRRNSELASGVQVTLGDFAP